MIFLLVVFELYKKMTIDGLYSTCTDKKVEEIPSPHLYISHK